MPGDRGDGAGQPLRDLVGRFGSVITAAIVFLGLTIAAMLLYPGGRVGDPQSIGYSFFTNFFSDLGQTHTHSGATNTVSLVLFCIGLVAVAYTIVVFFFAFSDLFPTGTISSRIARAAAWSSIVTAISFLGVAATPWNHFLAAHNEFVLWAFRSLLASILACLVASLLERTIPRRFALVYGIFAFVLAAYIGLITFGPTPGTAAGAAIQATGQKIIVYASVLTILAQAVIARALLASRMRSSSDRIR